jgi:hypothetical protein
VTARSHSGRRFRPRPRQCLAYEVIEQQNWPELYMHMCNLPDEHYGRHLCWCGWAFGRPDVHWSQVRLPEPSDYEGAW